MKRQEIIKLKIDGHEERKILIQALGISGFKVWQEIVKMETESDDYLICFTYNRTVDLTQH